jgi:hypothetical protein
MRRKRWFERLLEICAQLRATRTKGKNQGKAEQAHAQATKLALRQPWRERATACADGLCGGHAGAAPNFRAKEVKEVKFGLNEQY